MPTPMPIMAASSVPKVGTMSQRLSSETMATPTPMPNSAVTIGRPMAMSDPKAISRMTMAARIPMNSLAPNSGFCTELMG